MLKKLIIVTTFLGANLVPAGAKAILTDGMNCAFKCSGKQCGKQMHTLVGCLSSCQPQLFRDCWEAGDQKFTAIESRDPNLDPDYFHEFSKLSIETQNLIRKVLEHALNIAENEAAESDYDMENFTAAKDKMRAMLNEEASNTSDQGFKNWIKKSQAPKVRHAANVLNMSGGGLSLSN